MSDETPDSPLFRIFGGLPFRKTQPRLDALLRAHAEDKHDRAERYWMPNTPAGRVTLGARQPVLLPGVARERP